MPAYMLDSNALSELIRNPGGSVSRAFERKAVDPANRLLASIVTVCEIRYGVVRKGSRILSARVEQSLAALEVVPLSTGADVTYAVLRTDLERKGQLIGPNDMLIAAHALALDAILVTDTVREFKRVKGLRIENWLRA